jgi:tetratricopeptide (TPR) repeat protein
MPDEPAIPPRRKTLTPEQRRFMGTQRMKQEREATVSEAVPEDGIEDAPIEEPELAQEAPEVAREAPTEGADDEPEVLRERRGTVAVLRQDEKASRVSALKTPLLILAILFLLAATFYVGMKVQRWKYLLQTWRSDAELTEAVPKQYQALSAAELVRQALLAERAGNLQEAAEKFLAAKHKDVLYRGLLFRVGKISYDSGDFASADKLFERAIAFGENVDFANYFRGLIALRNKDLATAERFFEAAAAADPFTPDYFYYLAESLRLDHHPNEAIPQYERARLLARNDQDATVCQFKIRMALLEAGEAPQIAAEIEERKGDLPVDWLMTAAALNIQQAKVDEALSLIERARAAQETALFLSCVQDVFFASAAAKNPAIASACPEVAGTSIP